MKVEETVLQHKTHSTVTSNRFTIKKKRDPIKDPRGLKSQFNTCQLWIIHIIAREEKKRLNKLKLLNIQQ